jgi:SAM-dependent methyltransferase
VITRLRIPLLAATLFLSAFLLFLCQPMVGKMVLPYLGGAAAVWTTCVLFFQAMLLAGYVYAHLLGRVADVRKQILAHAVVLLLPLFFLPLTFSAATSTSFSEQPATQLLLTLLISAGVPFFVVSTTAPLVQSWFSRTSDAFARDPYFLYSASNAGSLTALIAYPFFVEPRVGVSAQSQLWFAGYIGLLGMLGLTAAVLWNRPHASNSGTEEKFTGEAAGIIPPSRNSRAYWVAAAFVPSALMLAVTNHIASNVGSVPFLWLVPLAIYLLTFIMAFARRFSASPARVSRLIPVVLLGVFPLMAAPVVAPPGLNWIVIGAHLVLLYGGALLCHTRLAESRPDPAHLTEFYFWISLGGVLGGVFTATIAPLVFNSVLEYPLLVALVPFFRSKHHPALRARVPGEEGNREGRRWPVPAVFASAVIAVWLVFRATGLDTDANALALAHTTFLFAAYKLKNQPQRFALAFAALILTYSLILPGYIEGANRLHSTRNFFGVKKVLEDRSAQLRKLLHGDTIHGSESTVPERAGQPVSYYFPGGSVSDVIEMMRAKSGPQRFGVVGLGAGTMAAYADASHQVTFYEIDPSIEPIAREFFTFLPRCASNCEVVIGDGRLKVAEAPAGFFDLLLLDAFSSDSVPTHLVSREALQLYLSKLAPDGILLFHVSNRYLNVEQLVSALVTDAGLVAFSRFDDAGELRKEGKSSANHLVAARRLEDLERISRRPEWNRVIRPVDFQPWTDDYSNLLGLIRWH